MIRGEIWTAAGGFHPSKPRPALGIQDDRFEATQSISVLPLTSSLVDAPLLRIAIQPTELSGPLRNSYIMVDKLTTVCRSNVQSVVGRLTPAQMGQLERSLLVFLGVVDKFSPRELAGADPAG